MAASLYQFVLAYVLAHPATVSVAAVALLNFATHRWIAARYPRVAEFLTSLPGDPIGATLAAVPLAWRPLAIALLRPHEIANQLPPPPFKLPGVAAGDPQPWPNGDDDIKPGKDPAPTVPK